MFQYCLERASFDPTGITPTDAVTQNPTEKFQLDDEALENVDVE